MKARFSTIATSAWFDGPRHYTDVCPLFPSDRLPKRNAVGIIIEDEEVAFLDTNTLQSLETHIDESTTKALPPPVRMDCKVVDVPTPAVMAGQDCADDSAVGSGNKTHARIPLQIGLDILPGVSFA